MTTTDANAGKRRVLTLVGGVAAALGLVMLVIGIVGFLRSFGSDSMDAPMGSFGLFVAGGFCMVVGLALLNAGTLRLRANYVAQETAGAVRATAGAVSDGLGLKSSGRSCSSCGANETADAKFCSNCGSAMA